MTRDETQVGIILRELQERAKELNCLYKVDELLNRPELSLDEIFRGIIQVLPPGWQHPHDCQARIIFEGRAIQAPDFVSTPWVQRANIVVQGETVGSVEVSYRVQMPKFDEGPFIKEERKLIETIADRIANHVMQRRLKSAFEGLSSVTGDLTSEKGEWQVVLEFLRDTDPVLLRRISRKLINHLSWCGVQEAKELLQRNGISALAEVATPGDENRPLRREMPASSADLTTEAFRIASQHLSESEILNCVTTWIKEEKCSFLVRALENSATSLGEIIEAIERYQHTAIDENELSLSTQNGLRVSLIRRFFSENLEFIDIAPEQYEKLRLVKVPRTWYLTSDWILNFVHHNELEDVLNWKYMEIDQVRREYPHLVALFK